MGVVLLSALPAGETLTVSAALFSSFVTLLLCFCFVFDLGFRVFSAASLSVLCACVCVFVLVMYVAGAFGRMDCSLVSAS